MTMKDTIFILATCIASAVGYGIIHDQITARICVEYFTIGHPPIIGTDDPTLLGIDWGILATWWVGLILGIGLTIAARFAAEADLRIAPEADFSPDRNDCVHRCGMRDRRCVRGISRLGVSLGTVEIADTPGSAS